MLAADLIGLEHESWIAYLTGAVRCMPGAKVTREGGVLTILSGLPMDWFDQVLIESQEATTSSCPRMRLPRGDGAEGESIRGEAGARVPSHRVRLASTRNLVDNRLDKPRPEEYNRSQPSQSATRGATVRSQLPGEE